ILANGTFPAHPAPLAALHAAERIVCCDGAAEKLVAAGLTPAAIVGDLDSLPAELHARFLDRVHRDSGLNDNDLAKAFRYCLQQGWRRLVILGATGQREDHTLGNLGWLADFALVSEVTLLTDTGVFTAVHQSAVLQSHPGQQVSLFTFDSLTVLQAQGLRYPVENLRPTRWWQATLNEACSHEFSLCAEGGPVLVFQTYEPLVGRSPNEDVAPCHAHAAY
ncbi:MAG: thiamine diphosphokinase, partial [Kiritimatiellia bacterium]